MHACFRLPFFLVATWLAIASASAEEPPAGPFAQAQCLTCHEGRNPEIVLQWHSGAHGTVIPQVDCIACHGDKHGGATARARKNPTCTGCHGGPDGSVVQSYQRSKHGIIASLEAKRWDWTQPLADGNYRTPTCAYCHMQGGDHAIGRAKREGSDPLSDPDRDQIQADLERRASACYGCHSPRFVTTWFASGERMVAIGRMKAREGMKVVEQIMQQGGSEKIEQARSLMALLTGEHLRNVRLGVFHQSPDHQWWHGQPALDGDLLRLKGLLGDIRRRLSIGGVGK